MVRIFFTSLPSTHCVVFSLLVSFLGRQSFQKLVQLILSWFEFPTAQAIVLLPPDMDVQNFRTLFGAIELGNHSRIQQVCNSPGFSVNSKIFCPITANVTCPRKKEKLFKYFGSTRVKIGPLDVAIIFNDLAAIKILISYQPDLGVKIKRRVSDSVREYDEEVCSAIHLAVILNQNAVLKELVKGTNGSLLSAEDHKRRSPLDLAFLFDNLEAALLLKECGATFATFPDSNISRLNVSSFMDKDCNKQEPEVILRMLEMGYAQGVDVIASFILNMDLEETGVQDCFLKLINSVDFDKNKKVGDVEDSYLHLASYQHCIWLIQYLMTIGFDPNQLNLLNENSLHAAARGCHFGSEGPAVVEALLDAGTDSAAKDIRGWTPLHVAIFCCNHSLIGHLMSGNITFESDAAGYNLLHCYCNEGNINHNALLKFVRVFDPNMVTKKGFTPLMLLINRIEDDEQQIQWILELLRYTDNIQARNVNGDTILTIALIRGLNQMVFDLKRHLKPDDWQLLVNTPDANGITPLMYAMLNPNIHFQIFEIILKSGADVNAVDVNGRNILYLLLIKDEIGPTYIAPEVMDKFNFFEHNLEYRLVNCLKKFQYPCDTSKMHNVRRSLMFNDQIDVDYDNGGRFPVPLTIAMSLQDGLQSVEYLIANFADVSKVDLDTLPLRVATLRACLELQNVGKTNFSRYLSRWEDSLRKQPIMCSTRSNILRLCAQLSHFGRVVPPLSKLAANVFRLRRPVFHQCLNLEYEGKQLKPEILKYIFVKGSFPEPEQDQPNQLIFENSL